MHMTASAHRAVRVAASERGFTLIELMITTLILTVVSGVAIRGLLDMSRIGDLVSNRSDMHSGVRNATELLSQEVGQAGSIALPAPVWLTAAKVVGDTTLAVNSTTAMFPGLLLTVDAGTNQETVSVSSVDSATSLTLASGFKKPHATVGAPVTALGGFASGIVPDNMAGGVGSSATVLKIFGDINGDGQMVYVEYTCDIANRRLFRNMMPLAGPRPPLTGDKVLIDNVVANPAVGGNPPLPCFRYQREIAGGSTYIVDVAITLTVESQDVDPATGQVHTESKALLNISPRNVFNVWQIAGMGITNRIQPMPPSVLNLLQDIP
jgi:prepilin-type N-terminal cleavage/methylation domain-containing protein